MAADGPREKLLSCENLNGDQQQQQQQLSLAQTEAKSQGWQNGTENGNSIENLLIILLEIFIT